MSEFRVYTFINETLNTLFPTIKQCCTCGDNISHALANIQNFTPVGSNRSTPIIVNSRQYMQITYSTRHTGRYALPYAKVAANIQGTRNGQTRNIRSGKGYLVNCTRDLRLRAHAGTPDQRGIG
jgi:hypothetical protein